MNTENFVSWSTPPEKDGRYLCRFYKDKFHVVRGVEYLEYSKSGGGFQVEHDDYYKPEWHNESAAYLKGAAKEKIKDSASFSENIEKNYLMSPSLIEIEMSEKDATINNLKERIETLTMERDECREYTEKLLLKFKIK